MTSYAIYFEPSAFNVSEKIMGRQSSGAAFLQAIADAQPEKIWCYTGSRQSALNCANIISNYGSPRTGVAWIPLDRPSGLSQAGLLYRPDPVIGPHAWHRLTSAGESSYSICGIIHTISSHGPMSSISELLLSSVQCWDALICTSAAGRSAVEYIIEQQKEHLRQRLGATRFSEPQMPIIPLGVHSRFFSPSAEKRAYARAKFGLNDDEIVVLFAGRLITHGKAHPVPMYLALEAASKGRKVVLMQAGQAPNEHILEIFKNEPAKLCPSVKIIMVDGTDHELYGASWSAADIFASLSDNFQETFGLTPIEAMAAGLPVVVSDWNGYRDTVHHGIHGFRIPTMSMLEDSSFGFAERYDMGLMNFDYYSGYTSQLVSVSIDAATKAFRTLFDSPDLRRKMGEAGRRHVENHFDWKHVFRSYQDLWIDLSNRRMFGAKKLDTLNVRRRPDRPDPFRMFHRYPSVRLKDTCILRVRVGDPVAYANSIVELKSIGSLPATIPSYAMISEICSTIPEHGRSLAEIAQALPRFEEDELKRSIVWMCKFGLLSHDKIPDSETSCHD